MSSKMEIDTDDRQKVREEVLKLMQEKDKIESSIKELSVVLNRVSQVVAQIRFAVQFTFFRMVLA